LSFASKIVLHSRSGYRPELDALVEAFICAKVAFVAVVGVDASRLEDIVDELCIGDGSAPYELLTSSHTDESLQEVIDFANSLSLFTGDVQVIEF